MFALTFVREARPIAIGSSPCSRCTRLAGITMRPAATSSRIFFGCQMGLALRDALHGRGDRAHAGMLELSDRLESFGRREAVGVGRRKVRTDRFCHPLACRAANANRVA